MSMLRTLTHHLLVAFFVLYTILAQAQPNQHVLNYYTHASQGLKRNLTFDDLPTDSSGLGSISSYSYLTFSSFHVVNVSSAARDLLSPSDRGCAQSLPNTLTGSRRANPSLWPRFTLPPETATANALSPFFHFSGLAMKPMKHEHPNTLFFINAYGIVDKAVFTSYSAIFVLRQGGLNQSLSLNLTAWWPEWGRNVNMVQIYSEWWGGASPDERDRDFCIDDLIVEFVDEGKGFSELGQRDVTHMSVFAEVGADGFESIGLLHDWDSEFGMFPAPLPNF